MKNLLRAYPSWLYSALPYVYLGVGFLTLVLLPGVMGAVSGLLLVLTGVAVWTIRYRYRKEFTHYEHHLDDPHPIDAQDIPNGGLVQISWSQAYECGHPVIDGQHRRLFGLANEAIQALLEKQPMAAEESLLSKMIEHMADHFRTEERILAELKEVNLDEHQQQHQALLDRSAILLAQYHKGELAHHALIAFLADEVIEGHLLKEVFPWPKPALTN